MASVPVSVDTVTCRVSVASPETASPDSVVVELGLTRSVVVGVRVKAGGVADSVGARATPTVSASAAVTRATRALRVIAGRGRAGTDNQFTRGLQLTGRSDRCPLSSRLVMTDVWS